MREAVLAVVFIFCLAATAFARGKESLTKYLLQADRLGPVSIGLTPTEASAKMGIHLETSASPDEEEQSCYYVSPQGYSKDIGFMVEEGCITRIDIISRRIASVRGIRVGNSENAVKRAFPGMVKEEPHPYLEEDGKYLVIEIKPGFGFIFETLQGKITSFRSGRLSSVRYIEGCL
jgi:hypothetical protein